MKNQKLVIGLLIGVVAVSAVLVVGKKKGWFKKKEQKQEEEKQILAKGMDLGQNVAKGMQLAPL